MDKTEKLLKQIIKHSKDKQATYLCGVEYSSETDPIYQAVVKYSKSIQPMVVATKSEKKLNEQLKSYLMTQAYDVNKKFHEEKIAQAEQVAGFHKAMLEDYEKGLTPDEFKNTYS